MLKRFFNFSEEELIHLFRAWAALTFAFAMVLGGGISGLGSDFLQNAIVAGVAVGTAFLLHELGHKFVAQKYGFWAEFRSFDWGLMLVVAMSFMGFIFAAPGAVMIAGLTSKSENGKISAIGPLINIILALIFIGIAMVLGSIVSSNSLLTQIVFYGYTINAWLALFNLIPIMPLDGSKVFRWSLPVWLTLVAVSGYLVFFVSF